MVDKELRKRIIDSLESKETDYIDLLRDNAIRLAKEHKKNCKNEYCYVQLQLLRELLKGRYIIKLTKEEEKIFI